MPRDGLVFGRLTTVAGKDRYCGSTLAYSGQIGTSFHDYSYAFGKERPFAPSLSIATNGAFDARSLAGSETCGASGCHTEIYAKWKTSAHRYAAMDPIFQGIKSNGQAEWTGISPILRWVSRPNFAVFGNQEYLCRKSTGTAGLQRRHFMPRLPLHFRRRTSRGTRNYTMWQPAEYLWQWSPDHTLGAVARNFLIRAWPSQHNRLSKRMYKKPNIVRPATSNSSIRK